MLLTLIYYYKNLLSINDIQKLLEPLVEKFYQNENSDFSITNLYDGIFEMCDGKRDYFMESINRNLKIAQDTFSEAPKDDLDYLQLFAFISILSQDVYAKMLVIEKLLDTLPEPEKK